MDYNICILITLMSGFSTFIGSFPIFFKVKNEKLIIAFCLLLSSFVMLYVSFFDLIPTSFDYLLEVYNVFYSILLFLTYIVTGFLIVKVFDSDSNNSSLYKVGIISMISLILHNIPEGIITFISLSKNIKLGISLTISIVLHNIPEGIAISVPIYFSTRSRKKALLYTLIASLSEPLGGVLSYLFFSDVNNYLFALFLSVTAGMMIYLSIFELLRKGFYYMKNKG
ncbi:MAG: ZIP family metal transporter [Bacilli bacterium]|nr:ZIP family metal transporter [Bacilli bacterium]